MNDGIITSFLSRREQIWRLPHSAGLPGRQPPHPGQLLLWAQRHVQREPDRQRTTDGQRQSHHGEQNADGKLRRWIGIMWYVCASMSMSMPTLMSASSNVNVNVYALLLTAYDGIFACQISAHMSWGNKQLIYFSNIFIRLYNWISINTAGQPL